MTSSPTEHNDIVKTKMSENFQVMREENAKMKREIFELLHEAEELRKTIEDKELQLREFITEFHQQTKENEEQIRESETERRRLVKERNELRRNCDDYVINIDSLRHQLTLSEQRSREKDAEILTLRQLCNQSGQKRKSTYIMTSVADDVITSRNTGVNDVVTSSTPAASSTNIMTSSTPSVMTSPAHVGDVINRNMMTSSPTNGHNGDHLSISSNDDVIHIETEVTSSTTRLRHQGLVQSLSGSLSRAFKRHRNSSRKSLDVSHELVVNQSPSPVAHVFMTSQDNKKNILESISNVLMINWKAQDVAVWLELHLHMSQYVRESIENVKSGKVLLGLSENEIERELKMENHFHRRKLLLALNELRTTTLNNISPAGQLDHWWISDRWLSDLSMTQYSAKFREHLIDGRMLSSLSKKEIEKNFGITNKLHQESLMCGIKLLQIFDFDIKRLEERRRINDDSDVLVWNSQRVMEWIKSIDLKEYSSNLRNSGIHGALLALHPRFPADVIADHLRIPINKSSVRRHLTSEVEALLKTAHDAIEEDLLLGDDRKFFVRASSQRSKRSLRSSISRSISRSLRDNITKS